MHAVGVARSAGRPLRLPPAGEIHVWGFALDEPWHAGTATLSRDEVARAARHRRTEDRRRFTVAHAMRREILSCYLGVAPAELRFVAGQHGKPALADQRAPLEFNGAASGRLGLVGVSTAGPVGVDLELIRRDLDWRSLAADHFTRAENMALGSLTGRAGRMAFFRCWTRKEAYVKARGEGLTLALDGFEVSVDATRTADRVGRWWVGDLDLAPGYAAAVAVAHDDPSVVSRWWGL